MEGRHSTLLSREQAFDIELEDAFGEGAERDRRGACAPRGTFNTHPSTFNIEFEDEPSSLHFAAPRNEEEGKHSTPNGDRQDACATLGAVPQTRDGISLRSAASARQAPNAELHYRASGHRTLNWKMLSAGAPKGTGEAPVLPGKHSTLNPQHRMRGRGRGPAFAWLRRAGEDENENEKECWGSNEWCFFGKKGEGIRAALI
jgi:hypothetical protein